MAYFKDCGSAIHKLGSERVRLAVQVSKWRMDFGHTGTQSCKLYSFLWPNRVLLTLLNQERFVYKFSSMPALWEQQPSSGPDNTNSPCSKR
jgi:hypothetical protein